MMTLAFYDDDLNVYEISSGQTVVAGDRAHIVLDTMVSLFDGPWKVDLEKGELVKAS